MPQPEGCLCALWFLGVEVLLRLRLLDCDVKSCHAMSVVSVAVAADSWRSNVTRVIERVASGVSPVLSELELLLILL